MTPFKTGFGVIFLRLKLLGERSRTFIIKHTK